MRVYFCGQDWDGGDLDSCGFDKSDAEYEYQYGEETE